MTPHRSALGGGVEGRRGGGGGRACACVRAAHTHTLTQGPRGASCEACGVRGGARMQRASGRARSGRVNYTTNRHRPDAKELMAHNAHVRKSAAFHPTRSLNPLRGIPGCGHSSLQIWHALDRVPCWCRLIFQTFHRVAHLCWRVVPSERRLLGCCHRAIPRAIGCCLLCLII